MQKSVNRTPQRRAAAKRPVPAKRPSAKRVGAKPMLIAFIALALVVGSYFLQKQFPSGLHVGTQSNDVPIIDANPSVRITEVMGSNASALADETGAYSDWIEITNISGAPFNLRGWKLAKNASLMMKYFEFPNHTLAAGERVIVYCTSTTKNNYGYAYHAPFKISAAGDTLILFNPNGNAMQTLNVPEMTANQVYAEVDGQWTVTGEYTPMYANTTENYLLLRQSRKVVDSPIQVTELMAKNVSYAPDENGEYVDWVEIYNSSDYAVSLNGYALSDSEDNLYKWKFPNVSIGAGEYMLVYCSGYDRREPTGKLHTNFRLSTEKEGVVLTNAAGAMICVVEYDLLKADQSYSRQSDGSWTALLSPTPGLSNSYVSAALIDGQFAARNSSGVFINEVMASTTAVNLSGSSSDWVELRNTTNETVDLSGWGLSDDASKPRKWQFPDGATIAPGAYMPVFFSGLNKTNGSYYHTNFRLSASEGETLVLSDPRGQIIDRVNLGVQYANVSYGRINGKNGFYYMMVPSPMIANATSGYESRLQAPSFSAEGGLYAASEALQLALTAQPGATIYYTLDCSTPAVDAVNGKTYTPDPRLSGISGETRTYVYTQPIPITQTTVVRAIAVMDGQLTSLVNTQTYLFGVSHTMQVISLVMNPSDLWDYNTGLYVYGPNALAKSPYGSINSGANFWMTWEKDANIELFGLDGTTVLSQGCGVKLHGQYSRAEAQKPFKIIARSKYGLNRFFASLFPNRDYTEYQSFVLRSSGQDTDKTRFRDSLLTSLAEGSGVMYQDTALAIVYLNGEYWGHYNMRERINTYSICQWEGWDPALKDSIDLIKANTNVMQGSVDDWLSIKDWIAKNGVETDEELAYVSEKIDVQNYLNYVALQMYTGNTDLLNVKKYKCDAMDGKWRWIFFDTDWAFITDTNSVRRWLTPGGVGTYNKTDNSLFVALMKNAKCKEYFLNHFSEKLSTDWSAESMVSLAQARADLLAPEIEQHLAKWNVTRAKYDTEMRQFLSYAKTRPGRLLFFFANVLSRTEMEYYFGDLLTTVTLLDDDMKAYKY